MLLIHLVRYLLEYVLPMRDILVLDEPMRKASLCCQKHKEDQLLSDMESGKLMSDDAVSSHCFLFCFFVSFFISFFHPASNILQHKRSLKSKSVFHFIYLFIFNSFGLIEIRSWSLGKLIIKIRSEILNWKKLAKKVNNKMTVLFLITFNEASIFKIILFS